MACHNGMWVVQWVSAQRALLALSTAADRVIAVAPQSLVILAVHEDCRASLKVLLEFGCDVTYRVV